MNNQDVLLLDASVSLAEFKERMRVYQEEFKARKVAAKEEERRMKQKEREMTLQFRIEGLSVTVSEREVVRVALDDNGFSKHDIKFIRQAVDNRGFRTEVIIFQMLCEDDNYKDNYISKRGAYDLVLDGYVYKTKITCYGHCYHCCSTDHYAKNCQARKKSQVTCYNCGETGHVKFKCPELLRELELRKARVTCYKCKCRGHYSNECLTPTPIRQNRDTWTGVNERGATTKILPSDEELEEGEVEVRDIEVSTKNFPDLSSKIS